METCSSCNKSVPLEVMLDKYDKPYIQKECKDCKVSRFEGCFYEPLIPMANVEPTFKQKKLLNRLIAWCFG